MATIDINTLATELDTDPRTARKFMRDITPADAQPGKGSRWAIEKREVRSLKSKFAKFTAAAAEAKLNKVQDDAPIIDEEVDTDFDALEPTDAELAELDD